MTPFGSTGAEGARTSLALARGRALRGGEHVPEIGCLEPAIRQRDDDLPVLLQDQARVQDRQPDEPPLGVVPRVMSFRRGVELHCDSRLADVEIQDVALVVVADAVAVAGAT